VLALGDAELLALGDELLGILAALGPGTVGLGAGTLASVDILIDASRFYLGMLLVISFRTVF
jgi:hypothetical protein